MVYGLIHTAAILVVLVLFFPQLDFSRREPRRPSVAFMLLGSFSFVGIGMIAAILPLLYVERGAQMTFVLQSVPAARAAASTTRSTSCRAGCRSSRGSRRRRTSSTASGTGLIDGAPVDGALAATSGRCS